MAPLRGAGLAGAVALLALVAGAAPAGAQEFRYKVADRVLAGSRDPGVVITPAVTVRDVRLDLKRADGKRLHLKAKRIPAGGSHEFTWKQPVGSQEYHAALTVVSGDGKETTSRFGFTVAVVPPLKVRIHGDQVDVGARRIVLSADRALARVEVRAVGEQGGEAQTDVELDGSAGPHTLSWPDPKQPLRSIVMRVHDSDGFWSDHEFSPWWVEVEHEEVNFDTAKATFRPTEAGKLDRSLARIREVLAEHGDRVQLHLYVAGYTDTVGPHESNQRLSEARARAIGAYLRSQGLKVPIFVQGFGERVLAQPTDDEVDEPANRRAIYILGNTPPPVSGAIPERAWRKL